MSEFSRRDFLKTASGLGFSALVAGASRAWGLAGEESPLEVYPARDWERVYRDIFKPDSSFVFLCAPNDTHNCLLRAYVRNGVITRIGPTHGYGKAADIDGNRASARWDPRCCQKGLALVRRIYGDRRVRYPMVRKGWKEWAEKGFPRDPATGVPPPELMRRGQDSWVRVTWEEASELVARGLINVAQTYSGPEGARRLSAQGYDEVMVKELHGAGTRVIKVRGGMPLLGATRIYGLFRFANSLALLDSHIRKVGPKEAWGAKGWDSYSWHTDLPPGHPMVTGQQTVDFDLAAVENAKLALVWGMNWISTKMPDGHWLAEARLKGTKVVVIACEYSSTANKADEVVVVRPGTSPALALGIAQVLIKERLYDETAVKRFTDLPFLVRLDTGEFLKATEVFSGYQLATLKNKTKVIKEGETIPPPGKQVEQIIPQKLREKWGDLVIWDRKSNRPQAISRDQVGDYFTKTGFDPALAGQWELKLVSGQKAKVRPAFDLLTEYLENFDPATTESITWAPKDAIVSLARDIARAKQGTLFCLGMGPNQFFNNDLKDRAVFLVAALTDNIGHVGGNVGSFAGNYRVSLFNGLPQYIYEDPFNIELDPNKPSKVKAYWKPESAHYYNYGDRPLRVGKKLLTGKSHIPAPSKVMWLSNSNSILGNGKWHYDIVMNTLPRFEMVTIADWWWSGTCEYADIVFPVDSWAEFKQPDMCASVTNPFLTMYPRTPLKRIYDTRGDLEALALVGKKLAALTGERRFEDYWRFVFEGRTDVYLQRILQASNTTRGYRALELEKKAQDGIPALMNVRTYPRAVGYEQRYESQPWYTRSGRLEFIRDEPEFREAGEILPVYREPIDSTFHEPNVIVAKPHPLIRPQGPEEYGIAPGDLSVEVRQGRNVAKPWSEVVDTKHPLARKGFRFIFHTPKYRHGAHTTPIDTDIIAVYFGPFGDIYRRDKRTPYVTEGYVDINPLDAKELGIEDGDYVWVDGDPSDRPFRGVKWRDARLKVARLLCRARYYPGTPRGVTRMWFNMYGATFASVRAQQTRPDGLAKNEETGYQAMFRSGSHQSGTRAWLRPTLMTDTMARKEVMGQVIGTGFLPDVHCPTGAPREAFAKITRAEAGGMGGQGLWRPAALGLRPAYESAALKRYLKGEYINKK